MKKVFVIILSLLFVFSSGAVNVSALSAKAAAVINGDTGELIISRNSDEALPMASTTKIMTALLLCENLSPDKNITVTKQMVAVEGSSMGLLPGDSVSANDLLYGMMLASGNDAANTAAIAVSGSVESFVELMNKRAREMGLVKTSFKTPSGLDGDGHCTTAYELALIARQALLNPRFAKAAASKSATLCYGNPPYKRTLKNHNKLLNMYDDVVGVKTGFTKKSGRCLVSAAKRDGKFVIAVTLNDPDDWADHRQLLDTGFSALTTVRIAPEKSDFGVLTAHFSKDKINITVPEKEISVLSNADVDMKIDLPEFVYAPVKKGEKIGSVIYYLEGKPLFSENINSPCDVKNENTSLIKNAAEFFKYMLSTI